MRDLAAAPEPSRRVKRDAEHGRGWYAVLARAGIVAKGASYALVAVLAFLLALGVGGKATSRQGALQTLAQGTVGKIVLVLLALGFVGYALWRLIEAVLGTDDDGVKDWGKRAGYLGRAAIYGSLTYTTAKIVAGAREQSQDRKADETTAIVLDWPAGRWIVGLAGAGIIGAGIWNVYRGLTRKYEKEWRSGVGTRVREWGARAGVAGHIARGAVFGLIGFFVIKAAVEYQAREATGLDGALRKIVDAAYGPFLLALVALGLVCYAVFCFVEARYRDVSAG